MVSRRTMGKGNISTASVKPMIHFGDLGVDYLGMLRHDIQGTSLIFSFLHQSIDMIDTATIGIKL